MIEEGLPSKDETEALLGDGIVICLEGDDLGRGIEEVKMKMEMSALMAATDIHFRNLAEPPLI